MGEDWVIYAVTLCVLAAIWSVVFVIPALLVRFNVISQSEPSVDDRRPAMRDWILATVNLTATWALVYWNHPSDLLTIAVVAVYLIAGPWWVWRSFKGALYAKQHTSNLTPQQLLGIIFTSFFFYAMLMWIAQSFG